MSSTNNLYNVRYAVIRPKYFAPFYNFGSLLLNTYEEGFLSSKQKVTDMVAALESKMMGKRTKINNTQSDEKNPEIEKLFNESISCVLHKDGREITIDPGLLQSESGWYNICIKSNRTSVTEMSVNALFKIKLGSRALPYDNEKYSIGVIDESGTAGFAVVIDESDGGVKGSMSMKVIFFDENHYVTDLASKYTDTEQYL